jgi:hypothetical protein
MDTKMNKQRIGTVLVAASLAVMAGCTTWNNMMGRDKEGEEHGGTRAAAAGMGRMEAVTLSGANEVPPVSTSAAGTGSVTVGRDRSVKARISVTGMNATAAHIHSGAVGANGPVIVPFTKSGDNIFVAPDGAKMTEEQYEAWKAGRTYVNVHSAANPGGEIRAQLRGDK